MCIRDSSKTLWVSGGSTGIGRATAIKFITQGWTVVISARDLKKLNSLKKEIEKNQRSKKIFGNSMLLDIFYGHFSRLDVG